MKALNYILFYGTKLFKAISCLALAGLMLIITAGIISRYIFDDPFSWTEELCTLLMVILAFSSAMIVTASKKHIVADFLVSKAPVHFQKVVRIIGNFLAIAFFVLVSISVVKTIPGLTYVSASLHISRKVYYIPLAVGAVFMCYAEIVQVLNEFHPGYDIVAEEDRKEAERLKMEESAEAKELQTDMANFAKLMETDEKL